MKNTKNWYLSKTVIFNALSIVLLVAGAFGFGDFQPSEDSTEIGAVLIALVNLVLRFYTRKPIK